MIFSQSYLVIVYYLGFYLEIIYLGIQHITVSRVILRHAQATMAPIKQIHFNFFDMCCTGSHMGIGEWKFVIKISCPELYIA